MLEIVFGVLAMVASDSPAAASPGPPVVVSGACACPAPMSVESQLAALAGGRASSPSTASLVGDRHLAVLSCPGDGTVNVVLRRVNGERIADRSLATQGSCSDLASAVAVIIGAWEADLDPRVSPSIALPAPPPPPPPASAPVDREEPGAPTVRAAPPRVLRFSLGVGLLAALLTDGQITPGATVQGDVLPSGGHLGIAGTITATTSRSSSVGSLPDVAQWSRVTLGVGPDVRFSIAATRVDLQAQPVAAILTVGGRGLSASSSATSLQLGGATALRAAWPWGTSALWVQTQVLAFPGDDRLVVTGLAAQGHLPHIELQLAAGLSLGRFP